MPHTRRRFTQNDTSQTPTNQTDIIHTTNTIAISAKYTPATTPKPMKIAAISDIHGNPNAPQAVLAEIDREGVSKIINCGDTHVPRVAQVKSPDGGHPITIVNAGSVGLPGYDDIHPHKHWIETGSPHARYALMEKTARGWSVQLRGVPYDFEPIAQLAERRQRPDWALPLRTGRMSESLSAD